ncbi:T9SS type A sorting domain-containing protein [Taibaiella koreensis]|uniref:T9SS type A sorting domain-containing protein n=1 Tax=Taibaiella koreensis TaxID=1268548 RepID=UPI000E59C54F|nr:T9SS type A sorting domain-containing protein [Taibaiella koreensis]
MKKTLLTIAAIAGALVAVGQGPNPLANPQVHGITAAESPIEVGQTTTTTFDVGNDGDDPIPAGGASFNISFPPNVSVNQSSLDFDGGDAIFTPTWTVIAGTGTFLQLDVTGAGIPAMVLGGPQTHFTMTVDIVGAVAGTVPLQQTSNALPEPLIAGNAQSSDDNAFGPIQVVPAGAFPIKLISFTGKLAGEHMALLHWEIGNPDKFSHFELERSAGGAGFVKVASQKLSEASRYQQEDDISNIKGRVLYRLSMVDLDGSASLSTIVMLQRNGAGNTFLLYPNPAGEKVRVTGISGDAGYSIYTLEGKLAATGDLKASKPDIALDGLASGAYWIRIATPDQIQTLKLIRK